MTGLNQFLIDYLKRSPNAAAQRKRWRQAIRRQRRSIRHTSFPYQSVRQIARTTRQFNAGQLPKCAYEGITHGL